MIIYSATSFIVKLFGHEAAPRCAQILIRARIEGSRPGPVFGTSRQQSTSVPVTRIRPTGPLCREKKYGVRKARDITTYL
jgi:hypothetical protein